MQRCPIELGLYQQPVWNKRPIGFNPQTGEVTRYTTELVDFRNIYRVDYSPAQVEVLKPHMHQTIFILRTGARKYTVEYEQLIADFESARKHVTPA